MMAEELLEAPFKVYMPRPDYWQDIPGPLQFRVVNGWGSTPYLFCFYRQRGTWRYSAVVDTDADETFGLQWVLAKGAPVDSTDFRWQEYDGELSEEDLCQLNLT